MTAYRWRQDDRQFASQWDEAMETAVDAVESVLYQKCLSGEIIAVIFYLKAHRPMYRDRLNLDITQMQREVEEKFALLKQTIPVDRRTDFTIKDCLRPG